eukprot:jgi/Chrzof1/3701/Cz13g05200.t1
MVSTYETVCYETDSWQVFCSVVYELLYQALQLACFAETFRLKVCQQTRHTLQLPDRDRLASNLAPVSLTHAYGHLVYYLQLPDPCCVDCRGPPQAIIGVFCMWRFLLGLGIGGDYPLSAVITSEYTPQRIRGAILAAVFSMQGIGILTAAIVALFVLKAFENGIRDCAVGVSCKALDDSRRICVALGAVPAILTYYLRTRLPETPRFTVHVEQDLAKADTDVAAVMRNENSFLLLEKQHKVQARNRITWVEFSRWVMRRENFWVLFGTTMSWFLLDIAYYCQNLFNPKVLADIGYSEAVKATSTGNDIYDSMMSIAGGNAIIVLMGLVPGYYFTVALVEVIGRNTIQYMGFAMMTILLVIVSAAYNPLRANAIWAFIVWYALVFFFANFGPNTTTFIIPGECYPTRYRSTCHGLSAAMGKLGAIIGVYGFGALTLTQGTQLTLGVLSIFMFAGLITTSFVPETKGMTLEELNDEPVPVLDTAGPALKGDTGMDMGHKADNFARV